ncbi:MAG: GTPase Era, partial [Mailhella sp.]|nr:GTPase Era [Mailhella sp.]
MVVLDADLYLRKPDFLERDVQPLRDALAADDRPLLVVVNKIDLFHDKARMLPLLTQLQEWFPRAELFPMSALSRDGIKELKDIIIGMVPAGASQFPEDQLSTSPTRFLASEIVREKVFERLRQEVPYSTAVDIEAWQEDAARGITTIHAVIFVARASHKAMVIGKSGSTIKQIGIEARKDIQELIGGKVNLQLWVKVKDNWAEDTELLHDLGLEENV